ncbi:phospholipid-transporting ATPase ABCA3-like isoform X1 [Mytilus galloprovincialis]|uniref:phospholipid-transporting ATPase ABCA3-like isoform X1 n=1 Tax=Mytilus galloprovincialis TaxID=29158 RepID=UPI003F7B6372
MASGGQFLLLMWKNWTLQKRKICVTVFEILLPLFFGIILVLIRLLVDPTDYPQDTIWKNSNFSESGLNTIVYTRREILFAPNNTVIRDVMMEVENSLIAQNINLTNIGIKGFDTEKDLLDHHNLYPKNVWGAVVFKSNLSDANVKYDLRVSPVKPSDKWRTRLTYAFAQTTSPRNKDDDGGPPGYVETGFLLLQFEVDKAIIKKKSGQSILFDNVIMHVKKMPYPPYVEDPLLTAIQSNLPLFLMLGFILYEIQLTKNIIFEKERKLKESMKMMGLSPIIYWLSWFVTALIYMVIACLIFAVLLAVPVGSHGSVLPNSDPTLMFFFFLCFAMSVIGLSFMISTFFSKANTGLFAGGMIYFLTYFPYFFLNNDDQYGAMTLAQKVMACLFGNVAMAFGVKTVAAYEGTGEGAQWSNFYKPPTVDADFTLLTAIIMLLCDTVLYLLITWYVDAVMPGEYGVAEPLYFPFTKNYWCGSKKKEKYEREHSVIGLDPAYFEAEPSDKKAGIAIQHLRKVYGNGKKKKIAVRDTTLNMYEGNITALLGHNGAGKTTTMSMLTGFIEPTSGTAQVNGYDIRKDITSVRKSIGLCPQHNILFETMTIEEHLRFFAKLKGCPSKDINNEVNEMISVLEIESKRNKFSGTLSGGQKRKLSVGIALIAGSKTVILDEPTSGMDPAARRQTWDILQKFRAGRTIVLSTHFMDEADLLGDRIAIMAEGVVKCCGTSYFLKKTYGAGYHLVMVKDKSCDVANVTNLVKSHVSSASLESEISAELSYLLPFDKSEFFEKLLLEIEARSSELGIASFGTTATTMEEVFLKVGESAEVEEDSPDKNKLESFENPGFTIDKKSEKNGFGSGADNAYVNSVGMTQTTNGQFIAFNKDVQKNHGIHLMVQQFYGMFIKKIIHTIRNRLVTGVQLIVPVIFTIMALSIELSVPKISDEPVLKMDLTPFGNGLTELYFSGASPTTFTTGVATQYKNLLSLRGDSPTSTNNGSFDDAILSKTKTVGIATFNKKYIIGLDMQQGIQGGNPVTEMTVYFNGQPFHGPSIAMAYTMNAILRHAMSLNNHSISTRNFPLPISLSENSRGIFFSTIGTGFTVAFTVIFGMAFLIGSFVIFLIKERASGAKHLQKVSGVGDGEFWFSNFLWDLINYLIPVFLIVIVFAAFNTDAFVKNHRLGLLFLLFLLFGWSSLPYVYVMQFLFKTAPAGMVAVSMLNILSGLATLMAVFVLKIPSLNTADAANALDWVFAMIFPTYCMGSGIMNVYTNYGYTEGCKETGFPLICRLVPENPCCPGCKEFCFPFHESYLAWDFPGVGKYVCFMAIQGCLFFLVLFLVESGILRRKCSSAMKKKKIASSYADLGESRPGVVDEDSDVQAERDRINTTDANSLKTSDSIVVKNLKKYYDNFLAVDEICVSVAQQECFGLLGQNGAGKTTTFKMLTGDVIPTSGNAWLDSHDIKHEMKTVQRNLGYCPQFDALIDQMTGRETLTMFARLRGVSESQVKNVVVDLLDIMMLRQYADKECGTYSGGNKRKLSTAIALIGDPQFVFLDEPTTGMDPGARRQLWNVLSQVRASGRTLVLTSHSMEECDALCTKIVIMVNGRFVCCGSSQHLKNKFGQGYTLICNMKNSEDGSHVSTEPLKQFLCTAFPSTKIFDDHQGYCHFQIMDKNVSLGKVFGAMESTKQKYNVEDYAIHQATLEQVFLSFTRNQVSPKEEVQDGMCKQMCCCVLCCCS